MTAHACPFCGSKQGTSSSQNLAAVTGESAKPMPELHFVTCMDCGARGPSAFNYEDAVKLWNSRGRYRVGDNVIVASHVYRVTHGARTTYKVLDVETGAVSFSALEGEMEFAKGGAR